MKIESDENKAEHTRSKRETGNWSKKIPQTCCACISKCILLENFSITIIDCVDISQ